MKFKVGDLVTIDALEFSITHESNPGTFWLQPAHQWGTYYAASVYTQWGLETLEKNGRLKRIGPDGSAPSCCQHDWKRYTGLNIVEDYCTRCNDKKPVSWRDIDNGL